MSELAALLNPFHGQQAFIPKVMRISQACRLLGLPRNKISRLIDTGTLRVVHLGTGGVRLTEQSVIDYLRTQSRG